MIARYIVADVFDGLASLPDNSVDLVLTSPPFLALRSYLPADHPDKAREIGSEPTPADFIDTLLDVVEACDRVLAPHGSIVFELGDTYSGSGGAGGDYAEDGMREGQPRFRQGYDRRDGRTTMQREDYGAALPAGKPKNNRANQPDAGPRTGPGRTDRPGIGWPEAKSLCLIPESFRWALAYGRNPFNGRETEPWRVRNVVRWHRPNPPVGALGDKFRPGTSDLVIACKSAKRYFDLDAVRTEYVKPNAVYVRRDETYADTSNKTTMGEYRAADHAGAPPLDTWIIPTQPYSGSHYATFPSALCVKPILAMCPQRVCTVCGEPSRRIVDTTRVADRDDTQRVKHPNGERPAPGRMDRAPEVGWEMARQTLGWTDCGHDSWRPGLVLDPFAGSGTTLSVATGNGRDAIGLDIDERNAELAVERVGGLFLTVEHLKAEVPA